MILVVGAGIVGLATARELLKRGHAVTVLEREADIAQHQSSHNSGVIHAGVYYPPGSLKAQLCRAGAEELYAYCDDHAIPYRQSGKLIVATRPEQLGQLKDLADRAQANGVPGLRRLDSQEITEIEPYAQGVAALYSPRTGIVDFAAVCRHLARDIGAEGGIIRTNFTVTAIKQHQHEVICSGPDGEIAGDHLIGCAGLWSDRLAVAAGAPADPRIVPFRGAWLVADSPDLVRGMIYPVPDPDLPFLGVHLTKTLDNQLLLGPSALLVGARDAYNLTRLRGHDLRQTLGWPGTRKMLRKWWKTALKEGRMALDQAAWRQAAAEFVPHLGESNIRWCGAGVRAQALGRDGRLVDDFVVHRCGRSIHVRNAPSPAATSSLALARLIADELRV